MKESMFCMTKELKDIELIDEEIALWEKRKAFIMAMPIRDYEAMHHKKLPDYVPEDIDWVLSDGKGIVNGELCAVYADKHGCKKCPLVEEKPFMNEMVGIGGALGDGFWCGLTNAPYRDFVNNPSLANADFMIYIMSSTQEFIRDRVWYRIPLPWARDVEMELLTEWREKNSK